MRIVMPEHMHLTYETTLRIAWNDMDAMGHVNNVVYFRYIETVRTDYMRSVGVQLAPHGEGPVVVNCFCTYLAQVTYPGELTCKHYIGAVGAKSFEAWVTLTNASGKVCAEGGATTVWFDYTAQTTRPLPAWLLERLTPSPREG